MHRNGGTPGGESNKLKKCSRDARCHNLNIQMYSFREILELFQLQHASPLTEDHMKQAKMFVLKMHPDKSRLPPDYFLFYKKAFDILAEFYVNQRRVTQELPKEPIQYQAQGKGIGPSLNKATSKKVQQSVNAMGRDQFQQTFNQLFEQNMLNTEQQQRAQERNQWFTEEASDPYANIRGGSIHEKMEAVKKQQTSLHLAKYQGVQTLPMAASHANDLYDEDDDPRAQSSHNYISTDPFSKLKFDDLRKVHRDQTVFAVGEQDYQQMAHYGSVDQYRQARGQQNLDPLGKTDATRLLEEQEKQWRDHMMRREYDAKLRTMAYEEKSKNVISHFLHLTNA